MSAGFSLVRDIQIQEEPTSDVTDDENDTPKAAAARGPPFSPSSYHLRGSLRLVICCQRPLACASVLSPAVPAAAAAPTPVLVAQLQLQPPPPDQSPTWLLERPANATRRRRLNRAGCQQLLGLPCACVACTAPILHAVAQPPPTSAPAPAAAPGPSPPAQTEIVYASQPPQPYALAEAALRPTSPPAHELRLGPASEESYDPGLLPSDSEFLPALALMRLHLHYPERGTTCLCPRCRARLTAA
eukprot:6212810-Pleurochrysis_carterae.AAC.3